jgi:small subunit ribosomal protein S20
VETALAQGDAGAAQTAFNDAEPEIRRGVTKGVLHLNTASRRISRLARRVKALAGAPA